MLKNVHIFVNVKLFKRNSIKMNDIVIIYFHYFLTTADSNARLKLL